MAYGVSNFQIKGVRSKISDESLRVDLDVFFPKLITEADFKGRSTFNEMKVKSEGHVKVNICKFFSLLALIDVNPTIKYNNKNSQMTFHAP